MGMDEVRVEPVDARRMAAVQGQFSRETLSSVFISLLDKVWAALREQPGVKHGHNIALYDNPSTITGGVEVDGAFEPRGEVVLLATPAGRAATATHIGPVATIGRTHDAIRSWCQASGTALGGTSWELYGDWEADENLFRTDVFYLLR